MQTFSHLILHKLPNAQARCIMNIVLFTLPGIKEIGGMVISGITVIIIAIYLNSIKSQGCLPAICCSMSVFAVPPLSAILLP